MRLEDEESAFKRKISGYTTGCKNILDRFQDRQTKFFHGTRQHVLKRAADSMIRVQATFVELQEKQGSVRNENTKDLVQQMIKEKESSLVNGIEHLLIKKQGIMMVAIAEETRE